MLFILVRFFGKIPEHQKFIAIFQNFLIEIAHLFSHCRSGL